MPHAAARILAAVGPSTRPGKRRPDCDRFHDSLALAPRESIRDLGLAGRRRRRTSAWPREQSSGCGLSGPLIRRPCGRAGRGGADDCLGGEAVARCEHGRATRTSPARSCALTLSRGRKGSSARLGGETLPARPAPAMSPPVRRECPSWHPQHRFCRWGIRSVRSLSCGVAGSLCCRSPGLLPSARAQLQSPNLPTATVEQLWRMR